MKHPRIELPVLTLSDPRLRHVAQPVWQIDDRCQMLIDNLIWTAEKTNGVGISAPQVGVPLRLFIVASRPNLRYPYAPMMSPTAMINPRIVSHADAQVMGWEGCLSVPDQRAQVQRYQEIEVEYCDRTGALQTCVLTDFVARIFQHELDHLDGTVFVDRVPDHRQIVSEAEYLAQLTTVPASPGSA
ncbi:MAG: peptide deformylase [Leptolyngbyaceae cyanobacterium]